MKEEHRKILELLESYLESNPSLRFGQALFNLRINEFRKISDPLKPNYTLRDIYNDQDEKIMERIESQLSWFELQKVVHQKIDKVGELEGLSINEKLNKAELMEIFKAVKDSRTDYAKLILGRLKVDIESINNYFGEH